MDRFGFKPAADPGILRLGSKSETSDKTEYRVGSGFGVRKTGFNFKAHNFSPILTESSSTRNLCIGHCNL